MKLDVSPERIYTDKGLMGPNQQRLGLVLVAVCRGYILVEPKLDRRARSVPGAREIVDA